MRKTFTWPPWSSVRFASSTARRRARRRGVERLGVLSEALRYAALLFSCGYGVLLWAWFVAVGVSLIDPGRRTPRSIGR